MRTELTISARLWMQLICELQRRGDSHRESGAFLLAPDKGGIVTEFICFDDLDPLALETGIIRFRGNGFVALWNHCRERRLTVVADAHTHSGRWTGQSQLDRTNPMINNPGHIALIVPHYARYSQRSLSGVGIYEYLGQHQWQTWRPCDKRVRLISI